MNHSTNRSRNLAALLLGLCVVGCLSYPLTASADPAEQGGAPADAGNQHHTSLPGVTSGPGNSGAIEITLLTEANKYDFFNEEVSEYNREQQQYRVVMMKPAPSRLAMEEIIGKQLAPILWSPGSKVWVDRVSAIWPQRNAGETTVDTNDPQSYGKFLHSPLVFLTTQDKAVWLRQEIGGSDGWQNILALSMGKKKTPWGRFSFAYADPLNSSTGMMTLGLILNDYAQRTHHSGDLESVANSQGFVTYLENLHKAFVCDANVLQGSNALAKAYGKDPNLYDFITTYESLALVQVAQNPNLAVIYPSPTTDAELSVALLSASCVTTGQESSADIQAAAHDFMSFLGTEDGQRTGVKYNFRPDHAPNDISLTPIIEQNAKNGFQQSYIPEDLPPYAALNDAIYQWRLHVAHETITPPTGGAPASGAPAP